MAREYIKDIIDEQGTWYQPARLVQIYNLSRPTIWRLLKDMRGKAKYQGSFRDISYSCRLVRLQDFDEYLQERSQLVRKDECYAGQ